jgi:predicted flap endonuclease-1-like 5' DNA nuclease
MDPERQGGKGTQGLPAGIGAPATRALAAAGCTSLRDVAKMREADVKGLHGVGPKARGILRSALAAEGLDFAK